MLKFAKDQIFDAGPKLCFSAARPFVAHLVSLTSDGHSSPFWNNEDSKATISDIFLNVCSGSWSWRSQVQAPRFSDFSEDISPQ
jgi:hypothetical protein